MSVISWFFTALISTLKVGSDSLQAVEILLIDLFPLSMGHAFHFISYIYG